MMPTHQRKYSARRKGRSVGAALQVRLTALSAGEIGKTQPSASLVWFLPPNFCWVMRHILNLKPTNFGRMIVVVTARGMCVAKAEVLSSEEWQNSHCHPLHWLHLAPTTNIFLNNTVYHLLVLCCLAITTIDVLIKVMEGMAPGSRWCLTDKLDPLNPVLFADSKRFPSNMIFLCPPYRAVFQGDDLGGCWAATPCKTASWTGIRLGSPWYEGSLHLAARGLQGRVSLLLPCNTLEGLASFLL